MWRGQISYVAKVGDEERIEKDCYEAQELWQVVEAVYRAVMINTGIQITEIHIYRKEEVNG